MTAKHMKSLVELLLNTRNFCGDEFQAYKDFCCEHGLEVNEEDWLSALYAVSEGWDQMRQEAGVKAA